MCVCTYYIATRSRYIPYGYNAYVKQIILELLKYQKSTTKCLQNTTAKYARNAAIEPLKSRYKVHMQKQINYCKT